MKRTKKIMSLALALVMLLTVIVGSASVFAANNIESGYDQNGWRIKGWVNLSNVVKNVRENEITDDNGKTIYKGKIIKVMFIGLEKLKILLCLMKEKNFQLLI